jgi:hypothetical protein
MVDDYACNSGYGINQNKKKGKQQYMSVWQKNGTER